MMRDFNKLRCRVCGTLVNHSVDHSLILLTDKVSAIRCAHRNICTTIHFILSIYFRDNRTETPSLNSFPETWTSGIYQKFGLNKI